MGSFSMWIVPKKKSWKVPCKVQIRLYVLTLIVHKTGEDIKLLYSRNMSVSNDSDNGGQQSFVQQALIDRTQDKQAVL